MRALAPAVRAILPPAHTLHGFPPTAFDLICLFTVGGELLDATLAFTTYDSRQSRAHCLLLPQTRSLYLPYAFGSSASTASPNRISDQPRHLVA